MSKFPTGTLSAWHHAHDASHSRSVPATARARALRSLVIRLLGLFVVLGLAACAERPGPGLLTPVAETAVDPAARVITIYVATTRDRVGPVTNAYTTGRSLKLNYAEFRISIPPNHKPGAIEWPQGGTPDPHANFVTVEQRILDEATFKRAIEQKRAGRKPNVGVFVHGFNTNFQEALFRMAQLAVDSQTDAVPVLFAWPSEAKITGYVADKDAVTFSRDRLVDVLSMLGRDPAIGAITVTGHSMGAWLTTEALRQLRLTHQDAVINRLKVILAAPDIDVDVFKAQMAVIGPLTPPMTVLVSKDDVALSWSQFISGERKRLGALNVANPTVQAVAEADHIQIVDISSIPATDTFRHDRFSELAALLPRGEGQGDFRQAGVFVLDAVGATVSSPFAIASRVVSGE